MLWFSEVVSLKQTWTFEALQLSLTSPLVSTGESAANGSRYCCAVEGRGVGQSTVRHSTRPRSAGLLHIRTASAGHQLGQADE